MKRIFVIIVSILGISVVACTESRSARSQESGTTQTSNAPTNPTATNTQTPDKQICGLALAQAPDIKGLKLGMTPQQVLALFPGSEDDVELRASLARPASPLGVSGFVVTPDKYKSKETFAGINQITFTLLDGRVSSFSVGYNGPEYSHVDKFVEKFVAGTNFPAADSWEAYLGMDNQLKTLKCVGFEVRVFTGGPGGNLNYVLMKDLNAEQELKERRAKARAKTSSQ